ITTFDKDGWVFGTEIPRLVVSEAYGQVQNDLSEALFTNAPLQFQKGAISDPDTPQSAMTPDRAFPANPMTYAGKTATNPFLVNFFVELHQPHKYDSPATVWGEIDTATGMAGNVRLKFATAEPAGLPTATTSAYRILIRTDDPGNPANTVVARLQQPSNSTGDPDFGSGPGKITLTVDDFTPDPGAPPPPGIDVSIVRPANTGAPGDSDYGDQTGYNQQNKGY